MNRDLLVTMALALVDDEGGEALSMRSLARRVDRKVASLYNHVDSRADLIEGIRARIVAEIDTSAFGTLPWDASLRSWARSYLAAFAAHPNVIMLLSTTPIRDASTLEMYDRVVGALVDAGWPVSDAVAVMRTLEALVLGSALDIVAPPDLFDHASVPAAYARFRAAIHPALGDAFDAPHAFEVGLDALLDGLRQRYTALTPASTSAPDGEAGR